MLLKRALEIKFESEIGNVQDRLSDLSIKTPKKLFLSNLLYMGFIYYSCENRFHCLYCIVTHLFCVKTAFITLS